ncbi:hypothetical protein ACHAWF_002706 [Thalassiosira exigua]
MDGNNPVLREKLAHGYQCILSQELFQSLNGHPLETLRLKSATIDRDGCVAFSSLLLNPRSVIQSLKLSSVLIGDDDAEIFGRGLAGHRTLKEVVLLSMEISNAGWQAFFNGWQDQGSSLETLSLWENDFNDAALGSLFMALRGKSNMKSLSLCWINNERGLTIPGWRGLFGFLGSQENRLEELHLSFNQMDDDVINLLGSSLAQNDTLKVLDLRATSSDRGLLTTSISRMLVNENSVLEQINLGYNGFIRYDGRSETLRSLTALLVNNTYLKEIVLVDEDEDDLNEYLTEHEDEPCITSQAWSELSAVLCDKSSIMATYRSNHILQNIGSGFCHLAPGDVLSLLALNKKGRSHAARIKIINTHFSGTFSVHPFVEMDLAVLPWVIAWVGRGVNISDLNGLYQILNYTITKER